MQWQKAMYEDKIKESVPVSINTCPWQEVWTFVMKRLLYD